MNHSRFVRVFLTLPLLLCASCVAYSLEPWFGSEVQAFEPKLLGTWVGEEEAFIFDRAPEDTYRVTWNTGDGVYVYRARLGNIKGTLYLDAVREDRSRDPGEESLSEWQYNAHLLVRVRLEEGGLHLDIPEIERLAEMIEAGHLSGAPTEDDSLVIVSQTPTLQRFLSDHGRDAGLWDESTEPLTRQQEASAN